MSRCRLSHQADEDLDAIADYLAEQSTDAAVRVVEAVERTFVRLAGSPFMGTLRDDLRPNLRVFRCQKPAQNYLIFYYPRSDGVEVSTLIHGARDYLGMFVRGER